MPVIMTARYQVRPQSVQICKQAIEQLVEHIRKNEPRTKFYIALQENLNPTRFLHTLIFESEAAMALHRNSKAAEQFVKQLYPETLEPIEFTEYQITGCNLDLL